MPKRHRYFGPRYRSPSGAATASDTNQYPFDVCTHSRAPLPA